MEDIKTILIFISKSLKYFIKIFLFNSIILIIILVFEMLISLYFSRLKLSIISFILIFSSLIIVYYILSKMVLKRYVWILNESFNDFLISDSNNRKSFNERADFRNVQKDLKDLLRKNGLKFLPNFIKLSLISKNPNSYNKQLFLKNVKDLKRVSRMTYFYHYLISTSILIPFLAISSIFTIGFNLKIKAIVFTTGILFFIFIKSAIIDPITMLQVKKHYFDVSKGRS